MLDALAVAIRAEDVDCGVAGSSERFEAFVALLSVVEAWCHAVDAEEGVFDEGRFCPFSGCLGVVRFDVAVYFADAEADVVPVWENELAACSQQYWRLGRTD